MRLWKIGVVCTLLVAVSPAMNLHKMIWYKSPAKRIQGTIVDLNGEGVYGADVSVYDHPEVWSDDSLNDDQKRAKQTKVATTSTDEDGKFSLRKLPKGAYEIEFNKGGFDTLSVIVEVDPSSHAKKFCVELAVSDTSGEPSFKPCK